jgi:hypothetical protein
MKNPFISLLLIISCTANAQSLPNVQKESVRAPANLKTDGKANEWGGALRAYNRATEVYYTLANDDENLYLTVQAKDEDIINKIIDGGVSLIIQKPEKKEGKDNASVTYPAYATPDNKSKLRVNLFHRGTLQEDADTLMLTDNAILAKNCKWIKLTGIADLDSLISVYNQDGIKAAALFNTNKVYTLEISIALKHLGISTTGAAKFTYHLLLNGSKPLDSRTFHMRVPDGPPLSQPEIDDAYAKIFELDARISTPTDFWGEYTLAKK